MLRIGIDGGRRLQDKTVNAAALQKVDILNTPFHVVIAVADQKAVSPCLGGTFKTDSQLRVEGVQHVGVDQTNGMGLFCNKRNRDLIGYIVELLSGFKDPLTGRIGDTTLLTTQNERNRTDGNIGGFGDITDRRSQLKTPLLCKK